MRLFIAIELPDRVNESLAELVTTLRSVWLRALRLVRPRGIHLTLKFLGDVPKYRVEPIVEAVSAAVLKQGHFALELGDTGVFPNPASARVLWVGISGQLSALEALHDEVEAALEGVGFSRDQRSYHQHLTVARVRDGTTKAERLRAGQVLLAFAVPTGLEIQVDSVSLMSSTLRPDGAVYERVASMPLRAGPHCQGRA